MKKYVPSFLLAAALAVSASFCQAQSGTTDQDITKEYTFNTVPIVIAGDAQLTQFAHQAFQAHGRYARVTSNGNFTLTFSAAGSNQVRVDVAKKDGSIILSQTASGANQRDALYRAADAAVRATGGGNGFFTSQLAFVSNRTGADEIYVGDLFLNETRGVTSQRSTVLMPRWSPDGRKILYTSFFNSQSADIFQLDLSAGRWTTYANFNGTNMGARYSNDGSRVALVICPAGGSPNIYLGTPDGRSKPSKLTNSESAKSSPCFSPDGSRIIFAMEPGPQLYVMSSSGGSPARLSTGGNYSAEPDWSRTNPNLIAFTTRSGGTFCIAVHDISTGKTRIIKPKDQNGRAIGGDFIEAVWLPDGRHVVCTSRSSQQRALYILDTEEKSNNRATKISSIRAEHPSVWAQQ